MSRLLKLKRQVIAEANKRILNEKFVIDSGKTPKYFQNKSEGTMEMEKGKVISVNGDTWGMESPDTYCQKAVSSGEWAKTDSWDVYKSFGTLRHQNEPEEKQMYLNCIDQHEGDSLWQDMWQASGNDMGRGFNSGSTGIFNYIYKDGKIYIKPAAGNENTPSCEEGDCMFIPKK